MKKKGIYSSLYWRIATAFIVILLIVGATYTYIVNTSTNQYFLESKQLLYKDVAHQVINDVPIFKEGSLNEKAVKHIMMHHMMVNPSCEVYILDPKGKILTYDAPPEKIKMDYVDLTPINLFIKDWGKEFVTGNDPRNPGVNKVFSAAMILDKGDVKGYVYVILASEEYDVVISDLKDDFIISVGLKSFMVTVFSAILIGLIVIWYLTKNLRVIESGVDKIANGEYQHEIELKGKGELANLADNVNVMAKKLAGNIEELKAVEKLRKELVANVSHDLRTPIAVVHGYIETLLMKEKSISSEDRVKYLNTVLNSTENLEKLVEDLFELTKLESGNIELKKESVDVFHLLHSLSEGYKILAEKKSIRFRFVGSGEFKAHLDEALMKRALQNLIENAFKYTESGGEVLLTAEIEANKLKLSVNDTGIGIEDKYIPFVFDRYKKVDADQSKSTGLGLGLAIVKRIFDLHEISITVSSIQGEGTSFSFSIQG